MPASLTNPNMSRADFPHVTTDEAITMFSQGDNQYRELEWLTAKDVPDWLYRDDSVVNLLLEQAQPAMAERSNPIQYWTEMSRMPISVKITAEVNSSADTIVLEDNKIVAAAMNLIVQDTGEWLEVTAQTDANVTVRRGAWGTTARTIPAGSILQTQPQLLAELDEPKLGTSKLPGPKQYNFVSAYALRFGVSHFQNNSLVNGGWGQLPLVTLQQWNELRRRLARQVIFSPRYTGYVEGRGQIYISGGLQHFIKSNILPIGSDSTVMNYSNMVDFMRNSFAADASSNEKVMVAGPLLYRNLLRTAGEASKVLEGPYWSQQLYANTFVMQAEGGTVNVVEDKHTLAESEGLGDWGIGLDMANLNSGYLKGFEPKVVPEVQTRLGSITKREDAIVGSWSVILKHESTHFLIKGAPDRNVKRVEIG
jgi:hypothetical protein